jgi:ADP-L-glycero-D-manno-heptose 6-epimerase
MILVTGGAGFIGSTLQAALFDRGVETVIADRLGSNGKWRNIARHPPARLVHPSELSAFLASAPPIEAVFHMGAVSGTMAVDGDQVWRTNVELSLHLWDWCALHGVRFIYASSAATYGDGSAGFDDDPAGLERLAPLNLYGWSKHVFDLRVMDALRRGAPRPPQWAGLKFFNVYGPNEYHKNGMISVVKVKFDELAAGGPARLFRSHQAGVADGAQQRDFVWVGDTVDVMLWLLDRPDVSGLFNVGTGVARSYLDMAHAVAHACGRPAEVEFVDMPDGLRGQYQSFTQARMERLRAAGYDKKFTSLEEGVGRYVRDYLTQPNAYR